MYYLELRNGAALTACGAGEQNPRNSATCACVSEVVTSLQLVRADGFGALPPAQRLLLLLDAGVHTHTQLQYSSHKWTKPYY